MELLNECSKLLESKGYNFKPDLNLYKHSNPFDLSVLSVPFWFNKILIFTSEEPITWKRYSVKVWFAVTELKEKPFMNTLCINAICTHPYIVRFLGIKLLNIHECKGSK